MSKFHINKHGVPAHCKATKGNCPLGGDDTHFDTKEEAQQHIDNMNEGKFGLIPSQHKLGKIGEEADQVYDEIYRNTNSYNSDRPIVDFTSEDNFIIGGDYFDRDSSARPRVTSFFSNTIGKGYESHEEAYKANEIHNEDAIEEVYKYYGEELEDPKERYKILSQAQALNTMYKNGTHLAYDLAKETEKIADERNLDEKEREELYDYMDEKFSLNGVQHENTTIHYGEDAYEGMLKKYDEFDDNRIPVFYHTHDYVSDFINDDMHDNALPTAAESSGRPLSELENYSWDEQVEVVMDGYDESVYNEIFSHYDKKRFDYLKEPMIEHLEIQGVLSEDESLAKIERVGEKEFLTQFNDYVFANNNSGYWKDEWVNETNDKMKK